MSAPDEIKDLNTVFVGVDGGGTGCRARIESADGETLGRGNAGPASLRNGADAALSAVRAAIAAAQSDAGLSEDEMSGAIIAASLAGIERTGAREALRHSSLGPDTILMSDGEASLLGAHSGEEGAVVAVGTGVIALGLIDGETVRIGGHGFPVGDRGGGADIGLEALRAALSAHDGLSRQTAFLVDVLAPFRDEPGRVAGWMESAGPGDYAKLAPAVVAAASGGDAAAERIVREAAHHIADLIVAMHRRGAQRISLLGGLAAPLTPWLPGLASALLTPPEGDAVDGALLAARREAAEVHSVRRAGSERRRAS